MHSPKVPTVKTTLWAGLVAVDLALERTQANPNKVRDPVTRQDMQEVDLLEFVAEFDMKRLFSHLKLLNCFNFANYLFKTLYYYFRYPSFILHWDFFVS